MNYEPEPTNWSYYDKCTTCYVEAGQPCRNLAHYRSKHPAACWKPHKGRQFTEHILMQLDLAGLRQKRTELELMANELNHMYDLGVLDSAEGYVGAVIFLLEKKVAESGNG